MKSILSIIAFLITFSFSVSVGYLFLDYPEPQVKLETQPLYSSKKKPCPKTKVAKKISRLMQDDIDNGYVREVEEKEFLNSKTHSFWKPSSEYVNNISRYVKSMNDLDDTDLPEDFQTAWRNHVKAWEKHEAFLIKLKFVNKSNINVENISEKYNAQNAEISVTWDETKRIAESYGASFTE